jgi:hypothetical protein
MARQAVQPAAVASAGATLSGIGRAAARNLSPEEPDREPAGGETDRFVRAMGWKASTIGREAAEVRGVIDDTQKSRRG